MSAFSSNSVISNKNIYDSPIPTCSSRLTPIRAVQEPEERDLYDESFRFLNALIKLKITDEKGDLTPEYVNHPLPLPKDSFFKTISELQNTVICLHNNKTLILNKILDHLDERRTFVGSVVTKKVLTLEYFYDVLRSLDISDPEHLIPESIQLEFNTPHADIDIRMIVQREGAAWVDKVHNDFIEWFRKEIGTFESVWTKNITKWDKTGQCTSVGLYIKLPGVDITLASKLSAPYLIRGQSLEIEPNGDNPIQSHCHHLQAIIDRLLRRIVPYEVVNEQGLIRILDYIKNGYLIFDEDVWNQLAEMNQFDHFDLAIHVHLWELMKTCIKSHPSIHPYNHFFLALNASSLFRVRTTVPDLLKDQIQPLWKLVQIDTLPTDNIISNLHHLFQVETPDIPLALLELGAFVLEILNPTDSLIQSKLVPGKSMLSYQLIFSMENLPDMHLQLKSSLTDAYAALIDSGNPLLLKILINMLTVHLPTIRRTVPLRDTSDLEDLILDHLHSENPLLKLLNFHLLGTIYMVNKSEKTMYNLMEAAIILKRKEKTAFLEYYLGRQLPKGYLAILSYIDYQAKGKEYLTWLDLYCGSSKYYGFPNFISSFRRAVRPEIFEQFIQDTFNKIPLNKTEIRFDLINKILIEDQNPPPALFVAYCKTTYELKHKGSLEHLKAHLIPAGEILLQFFKLSKFPIEQTPIRLELIPWIVESLIEYEQLSLARQLLTYGRNIKFNPLFNQKAADLQKNLEEQSRSFEQLKISFEEGTITFLAAIQELDHLITFHSKKAKANIAQVIFGLLWDHVIHHFDSNPNQAAIHGYSLLKKPSFQTFVNDCLPDLIFSFSEQFFLHKISPNLVHQFIEMYLMQGLNVIQHPQKTIFCTHAIHFLKTSWIPKDYSSKPYKKVICEALPDILKLIDSNQAIALLLEMQIQNIPITINTNTSTHIVNAFSEYLNQVVDPPTSGIKILKDIIQFNKDLIPIDISVKICNQCFIFDNFVEGHFWIQHLFQYPKKTLRELRETLLPLYDSWLKRLLGKKVKESQMDLILKILHEGEIPNASLWLDLISKAETVKNTAFHNRLLTYLINADKKSLFKDDPTARMECWSTIINSQNTVTQKIAQSWLTDKQGLPSFLRGVPMEHSNQMIGIFLKIVAITLSGYKDSKKIPPNIIEAIIKARLDIESSYNLNPYQELFWEIDDQIFMMIYPYITPRQYHVLLHFFLDRLFRTDVFKSKVEVAFISVIDKYLQFDPNLELISDYLPKLRRSLEIFQGNSWLIEFVCLYVNFFEGEERKHLISKIEEHFIYIYDHFNIEFPGEPIEKYYRSCLFPKVNFLIDHLIQPLTFEEISPILFQLKRIPQLTNGINIFVERLIIKWCSDYELVKKTDKKQFFDTITDCIDLYINHYSKPDINEIIIKIMHALHLYLNQTQEITTYVDCMFSLISYRVKKLLLMAENVVPASLTYSSASPSTHATISIGFPLFYETVKSIIHYIYNSQTTINASHIGLTHYRLIFLILKSFNSIILVAHKKEILDLIYQFVFFTPHTNNCQASTSQQISQTRGLFVNISEVGIDDPVLQLFAHFSIPLDPTHQLIGYDNAKIDNHMHAIEQLTLIMSKSEHPFILWKLLAILFDSHPDIVKLDKVILFENIFNTLTKYPRLSYANAMITKRSFQTLEIYLSKMKKEEFSQIHILALVEKQLILLMDIDFTHEMIHQNVNLFVYQLLPPFRFLTNLAEYGFFENNLVMYVNYSQTLYKKILPTIFKILHEPRRYINEIGCFLLNEIAIVKYSLCCCQNDVAFKWIDDKIDHGLISLVFNHLHGEVKNVIANLFITSAAVCFNDADVSPEFINGIINKITSIASGKSKAVAKKYIRRK